MNHQNKKFVSLQEIKTKVKLTSEEEEFISRQNHDKLLQQKITRHYFSLIGHQADDPLRRQCLGRAEEALEKSYESRDPLCEADYSPCARLIHRYPERVLLLSTDDCFLYCRHCFRRCFSGGRRGWIQDSELQEICVYLEEHQNVREILISGGDPLTAGDKELSQLLEKIRACCDSLIIRLCSRAPVVMPSRITEELAELLANHKPLWLVTQFNHPRELAAENIQALERLAKQGISLLNQTVLLKAVNDNISVLKELFYRLAENQVKPYYLFQGDLASGTSHLRVNLERGIRLMEELRREMSPLCLPLYAIDLPGGGGKWIIDKRNIRVEGDYYAITLENGQRYFYPREDF